jgi:hypothetical protein
MKRHSRDLGESINVRLPTADMNNLKTICAKLDLERSEICRRAIREGLKLFSNVQLPGVSPVDGQPQ